MSSPRRNNQNNGKNYKNHNTIFVYKWDCKIPNTRKNNAVLDTSRKGIDNVRELVKGAKAYLPYTAGKYKLESK